MNNLKRNKWLKLLLTAIPLFILIACAPAGSTGSEPTLDETTPPATEAPEEATDEPTVEEDVTEEETAVPSEEVPAEEIPAELSNVHWTLLHTIVGGDAFVPAPFGSNIFFQIADGAASGFAGCNSFNGTVSMSDGNISFGPLAATRKACLEDGLMEYEAALLTIFAETANATVEDGMLTLSNADGLPLAQFAAAEEQTLFVGAEQVECTGVAPQMCLLVKENVEDEYTFFYDSIEGFNWEAGFEYELIVAVSNVPEPIPADASSLRYQLVEIVSQTAVSSEGETGSVDYSDSPLVGIVWQWIHFESPSALHDIEVDNPENYTIEFFADGTYALKNDCNTGGGTYETAPNALTINPGITTLVACGEDSLDQQLNEDLPMVVTYVLVDGNLFMNLAMDSGNVVFAPAE